MRAAACVPPQPPAWMQGRLPWWAVLLLVIVPGPRHGVAAERILAYDSEVEVCADGALLVTEHITVRAEGHQVQRGIYRDFPTRYRDRHGNSVRVGFEVLSVARDGRAEPWFTERQTNGVRINTGSDDLLAVPREYTYALRFRTTRQLGFFATHDELYWNAIGTGWALPIEQGTVEVRLPAPVPVGDLHAEAYTGPQGARGQDWTAEFPAPGTARYRLTAALAPEQGLTVVLTFPKGVIAPPSTVQRARRFLADNVGVLVALAGLVVLVAYCLQRWRTRGRDPRKGVVIARYFPPEGHGPGGLRYLLRMGYDPRCLSGDVLALAVAGRLRIEHEKKWLRGDRWALAGIDGAVEDAPRPAGGASRHGREAPAMDSPQRALHAALHAGGVQRIELGKAGTAALLAARTAHEKALAHRYQGDYFRTNTASTMVAAVLGGASVALAFLVSGGDGHIAIVLIALLMLAVVVAFGRLVQAPTTAGRRLMDEIEGLRHYLGVAERDTLARLEGPTAPPPLDAERYEALLPYAVALEVEDAWTDQFIAAVGATAATEAVGRVAWYRGNGTFRNAGDLGRVLGSNLGGRIAAASSPPGGRSGSGGGGSSGGGGGGGGGGGR